MEYDDGATTLFLNVKGTKRSPPEDLKVLLRYLSDTTADNACTPELAQIQNCIEKIKQDPKVGSQNMTWQEYIERERKEAVEEQKKENDELKKRADAEKERADAQEKRAEAQEKRAEAQEKRADEAEAEVLRLKALLKSNGIFSD